MHNYINLYPQNNDDIYTNLERQKQEFRNRVWYKQEREKLIEEVTQRVLERLSVSLDISDALAKIEELDRALKRLGQ